MSHRAHLKMLIFHSNSYPLPKLLNCKKNKILKKTRPSLAEGHTHVLYYTYGQNVGHFSKCCVKLSCCVKYDSIMKIIFWVMFLNEFNTFSLFKTII